MGDFPQFAPGFKRVTITTAHPESCGGPVLALGSSLSTTSSAWPAANRAIYVPFKIEVPTTVLQLFWLNGGVVSGNVDVGICDLAGHKLVSTGSTAQAGTTTIQSVDTTDVVLAPGAYYLEGALDNATGQVQCSTTAVYHLEAMGVLQQATAFPLPATATFAAVASAVLPVFGLTGRTVI